MDDNKRTKQTKEQRYYASHREYYANYNKNYVHPKMSTEEGRHELKMAHRERCRKYLEKRDNRISHKEKERIKADQREYYIENRFEILEKKRRKKLGLGKNQVKKRKLDNAVTDNPKSEVSDETFSDFATLDMEFFAVSYVK